ncbi:MAG: hypothetical protein ACRYFK_11020 [Janthinobacterium lividum]
MHTFLRRLLPLLLLSALALGSCVTHRHDGPPPPRHGRDGRPGPPPGPYRN